MRTGRGDMGGLMGRGAVGAHRAVLGCLEVWGLSKPRAGQGRCLGLGRAGAQGWTGQVPRAGQGRYKIL